MINLAFVVSKEKEKSIGETEKREEKRGRGRSKKISPVLGPALIQLVEGRSRSWRTPPDLWFFF